MCSLFVIDQCYTRVTSGWAVLSVNFVAVCVLVDVLFVFVLCSVLLFMYESKDAGLPNV